MQSRFLVAASLFSIVVLSAYAAQAQSGSRFDGIWVGRETTTRLIVSWDPKDKGPSTGRTTQILIAHNGTQVGIIGGFCEGRFQHVRRTGKTLNFAAADCKFSVTLSPDGKTLIENGKVSRTIQWRYGPDIDKEVQNFQISGTFRRE
jgi:hypothetical protein